MKTRVAILGLGWLGAPLARHMCGAGYEVIGSVRRLSRIATFSTDDFLVQRVAVRTTDIQGDWAAFLMDDTVLVITFPPPKALQEKIDYVAQMKQITAHTPATCRVVFISSTSVYPNNNERVDEATPPLPVTQSGQAVLGAEQQLQAHFSQLTIVRLGGLIGPKRHPGRFLAHKKSLKNPDVPINLVHQVDVQRLIEAIIEQDCFGHIINGCADTHPLRSDFYQRAARVLGLPPPTFATQEKQQSKIVVNEKSKTLLNFQYTYGDIEQVFAPQKLPPITIIGAGPGSADLLTLRAREALRHAELVLYDNLVTQAILDLVPTEATCLYVGRKFGDGTDQTKRQADINQLMEKHCLLGEKVVRLKSGDPYIFGRAAEEVQYLLAAELPFEVVPGISAAFAAASLCNIPLTQRHHANAVLICTAHTADYTHEQLVGIAELLKQGNVLAVYMGLKSLEKLVHALLGVTHSPDIPIHAVSRVSLPDACVVSATLGTIQETLRQQPVQMPVVFIIGVAVLGKKT